MLAFKQLIKKFNKYLLDPIISVQDAKLKQTSSLLSLIILIFVFFALFYGSYAQRLVLRDFPFYVDLEKIAFLFLLLSAVLYFLNRIGRVEIATTIMSFALIALVTLIAVTDIEFLPFMVLPIIFAGIFLSFKSLVVVVLVAHLVTFFFPIVYYHLSYKEVFYGVFSFILLFSALILIFAWHRARLEKISLATLRKQKEQLNAIVNTASDAIITINRRGKIVFWSNTARKIFEYTKKEVLYKSIDVLFDEESKKIYDNLMSRFLLNEAGKSKVVVDRTAELSAFTKNKEVINIGLSIASWTGEGRRYYTLIIRDITQRKKSEKLLIEKTNELLEQNRNLAETKQAVLNLLEDLEIEKNDLEQAKARNEAVLLAIGDGLIVTDKRNRIEIVNEAFEFMLGYKAAEVVGKNFSKTVRMEDEDGREIPEKERIRPLLLYPGKKVTSIDGTFYTKSSDYYYVRKDKTRFPASIMRTPIVFRETIIGYVEVFRDITQEKEIDKAKTEFVSIASHQLRTPLSTIKWYAEMLIAGDAGKLSGDQGNYMKEIYDGNQRMIDLVNALLNVSRIELGTLAVDPKLTDLRKLADDALGELLPDIEGKKIKINKLYDEKLPHINVDPKLLFIVFQNLLSNAVKYTPKGGNITVEISKKANKKGSISEGLFEGHFIRVSDTGFGIPKYQQDKIFTKLFRADNVKAMDTTGTGLGLYIVKSIVDQANGRIWFESEENKGTTFYVQLPIKGMKKREGTRELTPARVTGQN
ncbi:PAS domain S-box protein [Candidatus Dojkabacteria bacterium]|nr:PAS domain S-box protein [Candidatus Dojkabacteria bacterium]